MRGSVGIIGAEKPVKSIKNGNDYVAFYPINKEWPPVPVSVKNIQPRRSNDYVNEEFLKNLQEIRIGRGIKSLLVASGINRTDKEIEDFVNKFKAAYDIMNNAFRYMNVVEGDNIRKYYKYDSYSSHEIGSLGNSCMKHPSCQKYFDMYCLNPDKIKLVVLLDEDKLHIKARALLWKLDDGKMFLDRIYTNKDSDVNLFREFAKKNNWYCKQNQQQGNVGIIEPSGNSIKDFYMLVTLTNNKFNRYPYMDTLKYYFPDTGILTNIAPSKNKEIKCYKLETTNGAFLDTNACEVCEGRGSVTCEICGGEGQINCSDCDGDGCEECDYDCRITCPDCEGTGLVICPTCQGRRH